MIEQMEALMTPSELKAQMKGVFIVQMTPFKQDGSLDLEGMRVNTRWLLERTAGKDFTFVPEGRNMDMVDLCGGAVWLSLVGITEEERSELKCILQAMSVLGREA